MAEFSNEGSEVTARILYWGVQGAGKTTNLESIRSKLRADHRGELRRTPTRVDPSVHFETLPIELGEEGTRALRELAHEHGVTLAMVLLAGYQAWLARAGCIASEMEAAALFVMAASHSKPVPLSASAGREQVQAGCVLAVFGGDDSGMNLDESLASLAEKRAIEWTPSE